MQWPPVRHRQLHPPRPHPYHRRPNVLARSCCTWGRDFLHTTRHSCLARVMVPWCVAQRLLSTETDAVVLWWICICVCGCAVCVSCFRLVFGLAWVCLFGCLLLLRRLMRLRDVCVCGWLTRLQAKALFPVAESYRGNILGVGAGHVSTCVSMVCLLCGVAVASALCVWHCVVTHADMALYVPDGWCRPMAPSVWLPWNRTTAVMSTGRLAMALTSPPVMMVVAAQLLLLRVPMLSCCCALFAAPTRSPMFPRALPLWRGRIEAVENGSS